MEDYIINKESDAQNANKDLQEPAEAAKPFETDSGPSGNGAAQNASQAAQNGSYAEPVIVTPFRPQHCDTYTGTGSAYSSGSSYHNYTVRSAEPSGQYQADRNTGNGRTAKKHAAGTVALCLVCGILGGAIFMGGNALISKINNGSKYSSVISVTAEPQATSSAAQSGSTQSGDTVNVSVASAVPIEGSDATAPAVAVANKVLPSIVGIEVTTTTTSYWYGEQSSVSQGSGVIFTEDGYIVTNHHVISGMLTTAGEANPASTLKVYLYTDPETAIDATLIGYDQSADLAVIKIDRTGLTAVEIGDSDQLTVGEVAIALGNPGGLEFLGSVSQGIISGLNRSIQTEGSYEDLTLIQTDAAINPGNSGGALVDIYGRLIGINSVKIVSDGYEGMGFAIPVNDVVSICTGIIKNGNQHIAYLGLELNEEYSASYLERLGYPGGLLVGSVIANSPAANAGIQEDDIIVSFDGTKVTTAAELAALKNAKQSGDTVTVQVYRLTSSRFGRWTGEYIDLSVTLG